MENREAVEAIRNALLDYKDRSVGAYVKGNLLGARYHAMLAGMWANHWHQKVEPNLFSGCGGDMNVYYQQGFYAYDDAIQANEREMAIRKKMEANKMKMLKNKHKDISWDAVGVNPPDKKSSFWNAKLW